MVTLSDDQRILPAPYRLIRLDDGSVLLTRQLRAIDAETLNRQWHERGIPTRWERLQQSAAVA
jgi:hypothetical protein